MDINNYIEVELYILVPVLYAVGIIMKKSTAVKDKWIPIILGGLGIILATVYKWGLYDTQSVKDILSILYAGITQGILCAAASVYTNNIVKQLRKRDDESDYKSDN